MAPIDRHECEWVREHLDAFLDGADSDLAAGDSERVARHLASCAECRAESAFAQRVRAGLRGMEMTAAPAAVIERAEREIGSTRGRVVALRPRGGMRRWAPAIAAAAVLVVVATWSERSRRAQAERVAVEQAAREAAVAFAYLNKYAQRTGDIVEADVIGRRFVAPVEKAMEKTGVAETKPSPDES
ncbi:MAG: anti-sigma factor [Candidatus Latescibacteria bacterium]|nr:anti-sigma factor [Candidatus Latescibacterota bacterium]